MVMERLQNNGVPITNPGTAVTSPPPFNYQALAGVQTQGNHEQLSEQPERHCLPCLCSTWLCFECTAASSLKEERLASEKDSEIPSEMLVIFPSKVSPRRKQSLLEWTLIEGADPTESGSLDANLMQVPDEHGVGYPVKCFREVSENEVCSVSSVNEHVDDVCGCDECCFFPVVALESGLRDEEERVAAQVFAWLGVWTQRTAGKGLWGEVVNAAVGQTAALAAPVSTDVLDFSWCAGIEADMSQKIMGYFAPTSSQTTGPLYTGRESVSSDGTLFIRDLRTSDTGNYTVYVSPNNASPRTFSRQLRVYEPVTKPTVKYISSQLVENRGPAEIACDTSTAAVTILWHFNSTSALPGNIIQSPNNRTLTLFNISRGDSWIYQCQALNSVSSKMSDPQTLTIAYGPEDVKIDPPGTQWLQVGTKLSFACTAGSFPAPEYQWLLNGTDLKRPGSTYTIEKVSSQDDGNYTCVAENTVTGLSVEASVFITANGSPCPTPDSCWKTTLGVACGVLLGAVVIVAVIVVHYERRLKLKDTNKDENVYQNPSVIKDADTQYENTRKERQEQSANPDSAADPVYME
ncbi:cell adhesion molecule CEACAM8-like [Lissotriton helveticus]